MMILLKKLEMMDELKRRMSITVVRHHYGVNKPMLEALRPVIHKGEKFLCYLL
jgi:hypothetical protein